MRTQLEDSMYKPGIRPSPDTESVTTLILDFPAWFIRHPVYDLLLQQHSRAEIVQKQYPSRELLLKN